MALLMHRHFLGLASALPTQQSWQDRRPSSQSLVLPPRPFALKMQHRPLVGRETSSMVHPRHLLLAHHLQVSVCAARL